MAGSSPLTAMRRVHHDLYTLLDEVRWGSSIQTFVDDKAYVVVISGSQCSSSQRVSDAITFPSLDYQVCCSIYDGL